jgi:hypothetical protein
MTGGAAVTRRSCACEAALRTPPDRFESPVTHEVEEVARRRPRDELVGSEQETPEERHRVPLSGRVEGKQEKFRIRPIHVELGDVRSTCALHAERDGPRRRIVADPDEESLSVGTEADRRRSMLRISLNVAVATAALANVEH